MQDSVKTKSVNLEDLQAYSKVLFNKGIGNKGICSTAGATADKEVNFGTTYSLVDGAMAVVRFTYGIGAANATLRVNSQVDANEEPVRKPIYYKNAPVPAGLIKAGTTLLLKYENSNNNRWVIIGEYYDTMGGADGTNAGASGLVPAPTATDNNKYLRGDGTWAEVSGGGSIVSPTYDSTNHSIVFPNGSGATYNSTTHSISF